MQIKLPKNYNGVVEQIIRPTGLIDPIVDIRPALAVNYSKLKTSLLENKYQFMTSAQESYIPTNQIDDLIKEIRLTIKKKQRILVTTLTKKMAEELTEFLKQLEIAVQYLHSDIDTIERVEILRDLRKGKYDVIVGINLLREGLDLPEVSLVAILDADKEGFLRSSVSLIQTIGRAARHVEGRVIMYADKVTGSMKKAIDETQRRRKIQLEYNSKNNINPQTILKKIKDYVVRIEEEKEVKEEKSIENLRKKAESYKILSNKEKKVVKHELELQMRMFADMMEFEKAAEIRDILNEL